MGIWTAEISLRRDPTVIGYENGCNWGWKDGTEGGEGKEQHNKILLVPLRVGSHSYLMVWYYLNQVY